MLVQFNSVFLTNKNNYNFQGKRKENIEQLINEKRMVDSFIRFVKIDSGSNEKRSESKIPSTDCQMNFANILKEELHKRNLEDIEIDEHGILTATLKGNTGENTPVIGLLAHLDTSPDAPNKNVKPQIHDYNGGDIKLAKGAVITAEELKDHVGKKIITSSGKTLLGADDKAGIAEILEAIDVFMENSHLKRPDIRIAFTPDEETGMGVDKFNIKKFGADLAYTVDGDAPHLLQNETFNAFNPTIVITGKNTHTGYAYKMINSLKIAQKFLNAIPKKQAPETTKGKQGYFHLDETAGKVPKTTIKMLVRDFDYNKAQSRVEFLKSLALKIQKENPGCTITIDPKERYLNMKRYLDEFPEVVNYAEKGIRRSGLIPKATFVRGGTDGSNLSKRGLLTPNIGAGMQNIHSKTEFLPIEDMKKCAENIINILMVWAENSNKIMPKILARRQI